jgi:hypothetical protein
VDAQIASHTEDMKTWHIKNGNKQKVEQEFMQVVQIREINNQDEDNILIKNKRYKEMYRKVPTIVWRNKQSTKTESKETPSQTLPSKSKPDRLWTEFLQTLKGLSGGYRERPEVWEAVKSGEAYKMACDYYTTHGECECRYKMVTGFDNKDDFKTKDSDTEDLENYELYQIISLDCEAKDHKDARDSTQ